MIPLAQWNHFTTNRRAAKILSGEYTFIPSNSYGIKPGYFRDADLVLVLRERKAEPEVVQFILDMLE
jgi:hypothetical protein